MNKLNAGAFIELNFKSSKAVINFPEYQPNMNWNVSAAAIAKIIAWIVSAVGGGLLFTTAIQAINHKVKVRRMRKHLYREISKNHHNIDLRIAICTSLQGLREGAALRFTDKLDISFYAWNFYNDEKRRDLLFELKEAGEISQIYDKLNLMLLETQGYAMTRAREAMAVIEERLADSTLDNPLYKSVSSFDAWKNMELILNGTRERSRKSLNPI